MVAVLQWLALLPLYLRCCSSVCNRSHVLFTGHVCVCVCVCVSACARARARTRGGGRLLATITTTTVVLVVP